MWFCFEPTWSLLGACAAPHNLKWGLISHMMLFVYMLGFVCWSLSWVSGLAALFGSVALADCGQPMKGFTVCVSLTFKICVKSSSFFMKYLQLLCICLYILIPALLTCLCPLPLPAGQWIGIKLTGMCINPLMQTVIHSDTSGQKLHRINWSYCCCCRVFYQQTSGRLLLWNS